MKPGNYTPHYLKIQDYVIKKIESGEYTPGDKIPSESALSALFSVSRITVNKALKELSIMGIIERKRGLGSFVSKEPPAPISSKAFVTAAKLEVNAKRNHSLLQFKVVKSSPELLSLTGFGEEDGFYEIILANQNGTVRESIDISYIPCRLVPDMTQHLDGLSDNFVFGFLKNYPGIQPEFMSIFVNIPPQPFIKPAMEYLDSGEALQVWKTCVLNSEHRLLSMCCPIS